jgi:predicted phosphodiesterase
MDGMKRCPHLFTLLVFLLHSFATLAQEQPNVPTPPPETLPVTQPAVEITQDSAILEGYWEDAGGSPSTVYFKIRERVPDMEETWWIIADTHIGSFRPGEENALENLRKAIADVNKLGISQKAIVLGDLVHDRPEFVGDFVSTMDQLNHEWTYVLGNHDFDRRRTEARVMDPVWFQLDVGGIRIIALSDEGRWVLSRKGRTVTASVQEGYQRETNLSEEQNNWFREALDRDPDKPTILWSHQGLRRAFERADDDGPCYWDPKRRGWLQENWNRYNIMMWVRGHRHPWELEEDYQGLGFVDVSPGALASDSGGGIFMIMSHKGDSTSVVLRFRSHLEQTWISVKDYEQYELTVAHPWLETTHDPVESPGAFRAAIGGLQPEKTYEYKAVVESKGEISIGEVETFTTASAPDS